MYLRRALRDDEYNPALLVTGDLCVMQDLVFLRPVPIQNSPHMKRFLVTRPSLAIHPRHEQDWNALSSRPMISHAGPDLWNRTRRRKPYSTCIALGRWRTNLCLSPKHLRICGSSNSSILLVILDECCPSAPEPAPTYFNYSTVRYCIVYHQQPPL